MSVVALLPSAVLRSAGKKGREFHVDIAPASRLEHDVAQDQSIRLTHVGPCGTEIADGHMPMRRPPSQKSGSAIRIALVCVLVGCHAALQERPRRVSKEEGNMGVASGQPGSGWPWFGLHCHRDGTVMHRFVFALFHLRRNLVSPPRQAIESFSRARHRSFPVERISGGKAASRPLTTMPTCKFWLLPNHQSAVKGPGSAVLTVCFDDPEVRWTCNWRCWNGVWQR